jgi:hypothetical protein
MDKVLQKKIDKKFQKEGVSKGGYKEFQNELEKEF